MITCIGTITKDVVHFKGKTQERLGGAPFFFHQACLKLGVTPQIVSKACKTLFPHFDECRGLQEGVTTTLEIFESETETKCICKSYSGPVDLAQIPSDLLDADIVFISTLYGDIDIPKVKGQLAIDLQGFMRPGEQILCDHNKKTPAKLAALLRETHILKCNEQEARTIFGNMPIESMLDTFRLLGPKIVLITLGKNGIAIGFGDTCLHLPIKAVKGIDTVGAGDSFFSFFLISFDRSHEIVESVKKAIEHTTKLLEERK